MRLVAISMVKNESDIVELFARHALHLFDALFVIDNGSTDGTRQILSELAREGLPLDIIDDPTPARRQSETMTRLLRRALQRHGPDYVVALDADEFMGVRSRSDLEGALAQLPAGHYGLIPWRTHVLRPDDLAGPENVLLRLRWRRSREQPVFWKVVIPARAEWMGDVVLAEGNHDLHRRHGEPVPSVALEGLTIRHYPVRGLEQLRSKILQGWLAYVVRELVDGVPAGNRGWHWKSIYDLILERDLTPDDVTRLSANYAQHRDPLAPVRAADLVEDPIELTVEAHIPVSPGDALRALARQADAVARAARDAQASTIAAGDELHVVKGQLATANQRVDALEADVARLGTTLDSVLASTSWRLTAPLRWAGARARRRRGGRLSSP